MPHDLLQPLRDALAAHIGYTRRADADGTELPWSWTNTGEGSEDFSIGTCCGLEGDGDLAQARLIAGYVDSKRFSAEHCPADQLVLPIDEVCTAENASLADADLIVAAVNAAPFLLAEYERLTTHLINAGDAEWCGMDCGTLILDGDKMYVVTFEDDDTARCCAKCYAALPKKTAEVSNG